MKSCNFAIQVERKLLTNKLSSFDKYLVRQQSRSGSNGKDNFAACVKIYWRVESDSTLPIDEYYFVRSEHWFAINGSYSATQLNAWNIARILSAWEDDRCNGS